jgi:hypothetical protein
MQQVSTRLTRPLIAAVLAAALVAVATAPAADAAVPKTGTWSGDFVQELAWLPGTPYKTRMVITAYEGRIQSVVATVRMECPASLSVRDARVVESWWSGSKRGPRISRRGGYAFRADGVYFHGVLSKSSAIGAARATYGEDCSGTGRHNLQRRHF